MGIGATDHAVTSLEQLHHAAAVRAVPAPLPLVRLILLQRAPRRLRRRHVTIVFRLVLLVPFERLSVWVGATESTRNHHA
jgi:hypothetical protein